MAGLLPENEPERTVVEGWETGPQPEVISRVFGTPYTVGDKTVIPLSTVRFIVPRGSQAKGSNAEEHEQTAISTKRKRRGWQAWRQPRLIGASRPFGVVEVGAKGVEVKPAFNIAAVAIVGTLAGAWDLYWILRTVRELWRRK
jgi:hypothetical protein